ncbi:hypothetical protein MNEG_8253 [Monoraphidium neglectum]|uniref:RING-type E3 ubiquitin transferase n=1 Tax=Monoraphidium neglectum TaxID=145388 RepID=A0A0D2KWT4_9CHLO|nr:hypothetical protein MNEG_8253 [Monoraphidium neglectum]KIY99708.1 hypothetical protein MNEG_8253 [Monoraphidium neglectum]|eukprot:XP_013898728.1 hypothetical protein MNEG_8253 [Monoraphidium neglectum]
MPRELVSAGPRSGGLALEDWLKLYWRPGNYNSGRCAEFQFSGRKPNGDLLYKLVAITDDYRGRKASIYRAPLQRGRLCASICLLEPPHEVDLAAVCVKQDDDTVYYDEQRLGVGAGWDVTLDADYARIQNCAFAAAGPGIGRSEAVDNLDVALSVLRVHQTFLRTQPQLQRLTRIVHEAPKMRDTMQKYIACIASAGAHEFDAAQLETMFNTAVERNMRHSGRGAIGDPPGDVRALFGFLVMMPLVKRHYTPECDPWTLAPTIYDAFLSTINALPMDDYHKCVVQMGKVFGSVARRGAGRALRTLRTERRATRHSASYSDRVGWLQAGEGVRCRRVASGDNGDDGDEAVRVIGESLERWSSVSFSAAALEGGGALTLRFAPTHPAEGRAKLSLGRGGRVWLDTYAAAPVVVSRGGGGGGDGGDGGSLVVSCAGHDTWHLPLRDAARAPLVLAFRHAIMEVTLQAAGGAAAAASRAALRAARAYNSEPSDVCIICLDDLVGGESRAVLRCRHQFHADCIAEWRRRSGACPLCNQSCG